MYIIGCSARAVLQMELPLVRTVKAGTLLRALPHSACPLRNLNP